MHKDGKSITTKKKSKTWEHAFPQFPSEENLEKRGAETHYKHPYEARSIPIQGGTIQSWL